MAMTFLERAETLPLSGNADPRLTTLEYIHEQEAWAAWVLECWSEIREAIEAARWQSDQDAADERIHDSTECDPSDCQAARLRIALDDLDRAAAEEQ